MGELRRTFGYIFDRSTPAGGGLPEIDLFAVHGAFSLGRTEVIPVPLWHGRRLVQGYRIGSLAYLTDCSAIPDSSWELLDGVDVVVIDALRHRPHPTHFTVAEALAAVQRLAPVARVVHAHLPRPAARRHHRQPARGRRTGI